MTTYFLSKIKSTSSQCCNCERREQVINNINNMHSSQIMCIEKSIKQQAGCYHSFSATYELTLFNMHILCVYQALFSDLSNRLENKTNYTQNVCSNAQRIILLSLSGFLYSTASFDMWHAL